MSPAESDCGERITKPVWKAEDGTLPEAKRSLLLQQLEAQLEPDVIPDLVKLLASDQDEEVRVLAASALGRTRHADAIPHLGQILADAREDLMLRRTAAWGLHRIQDADAVTHLGQVLIDKDEAYEIRWTAAEALKEMGRIDTICYLGKALADQSPQIQKIAAQALLDMDHPHAVPHFRSALKEVGNPEVRRIAAMALGRARDMDAIPLLGRALTEDENGQRGQWQQTLSSSVSRGPDQRKLVHHKNRALVGAGQPYPRWSGWMSAVGNRTDVGERSKEDGLWTSRRIR